MSQALALCFQGDEDKQISFHGVAYVNLVPLLCPGVSCIRGAFRVFGYQDSEVLEKVRAEPESQALLQLCACAQWGWEQVPWGLGAGNMEFGSRQHEQCGPRGIWEQAVWGLGAGSVGLGADCGQHGFGSEQCGLGASSVGWEQAV